MKPYLVAPEAEGDLRQIWRYLLGEAGLAIANRIQGELVDAFEGLADVPSKGHCAIACFDQALADVGLADKGALRQVLRDYFAWATTKTMSRYHQSADDVPNGLSIPHWSWDGLQV